MKYKYHATCSQCGRKFYSNLRSELLEKLRKHLWKSHAEWMKRRIKKGKAKAKKSSSVIASSNNPAWLTTIAGHIFPPLQLKERLEQYKSMTPEQRTTVKALVRGLTVPIGPEASAVAEMVLRAFDTQV